MFIKSFNKYSANLIQNLECTYNPNGEKTDLGFWSKFSNQS